MHSVTVAVIGICGAAHLRRCLDALAAQVEAPPFDIVVVYDPELTDVSVLRERYVHIRMIANPGQRTPLELASRAIQESRGEFVLLTEDHCVPRCDWVGRLCKAQHPQRAAVGGAVVTDNGASNVEWAFYFADFYRYAKPLAEGAARTLTVCNVAYRRAYLDRIRPLWENFFHETAVNDALRERFGPLWMIPEAEVRTRRHVSFPDAVLERYAFGRLFGCTRLEFAGRVRRLYYTVFAPALPLLLLGRMAAAALVRRRLWGPFIGALPALTAMVLAWSWGEWLGYLTRHRPRSLAVAQEVRD